MKTGRLGVAIAVVLVVLVGSTVPGMVASAYEDQVEESNYQVNQISQDGLEITTEYPTSEESQAVDVTVTVSPSETEITNITIAISNTNSAFVDFDSFGKTIEPSGAAQVEEELQFRRQNQLQVYTIDSLRTDQSVTITFTTYPRTLQSDNQRLNVARIHYEFLRNGIQVPDDSPGRATAVADISSSPVYEAQSLSTRIKGLWVTTGVAVVLGIVGIVAAVWMYLNRDSGPGPIRSEVNDILEDFDNLKDAIEATGSETALEIAENIEKNIKELKYK